MNPQNPAQQPYPPQQPGYPHDPYAQPGPVQQSWPQQYQQPYPPQPQQQYMQAGPVFRAKFRKHTGLLILAQWQDSYVTGSYEDVRKAYRAAQTHNLLAGWWGVISLLVYNWIAIIGNISAMSDVKAQARAAGLEV